MSVPPPSDSPTRTIAPAEAGPDLVTATLAPAGSQQHDRMATQAPTGEPIHFTRPFDGPDCPTEFPTPDDRYTKQEFIARGGMGEVFTARDRVLNRDVAVKILREDLKDRSYIASRFIEEARITGKLQHPGIPPVHDLGTFHDGRPFIAMKLIKGRTLSDLLATDRPDFAELLRIFDYVCQAVAYAHDRRVIHRDLKPGNVMVGAFNEVQVMDWGLAKVLGELPAASEHRPPSDHPTSSPVSVIESDRDPSSHTRAGSLLGTPAYMPPEQAKGEIDRTDTRSDVFALGAMLCELLTGKPPYWAATSAEIQALAITAQLGPAFERLDSCNADPELVALAKHCLSANPDDRPADAKQVAKSIAFFRAGVEDRLRRAERDRAAAEAKAAEEVNTRREAGARESERRKRRRTQLALAAAAILLLAVGAFGWVVNAARIETREALDKASQARDETASALVLLNQEKQKTEQSRAARNGQAIETLLIQAEEAQRSDDSDRAANQLGQIDKRLADGGAEHLAARIDRCRTDLATLRELDRANEILWTQDDSRSRNAQASAVWSAAFKTYGFDHEAPRHAEAVAAVNASLIRERLLLALDLWHTYRYSVEADDSSLKVSVGAERKAVRKFLDLLDTDPFRREVRNAISRSDEALFKAFVEDPQILRQPVRFSIILGQLQYLPLETREQLLRPALEKAPNDLSLLFAVISMYQSAQYTRSVREAVQQQLRYSQAAVAVRPGSKVAWQYLARAQWDKGSLDDSIRSYRRALRIEPDEVYTLSYLSAVLVRKHDPEAALPYSQKAVALKPDSALGHNNLGSVYDRMNDVDAALRCFSKAVDLDPQSALYHNNLGYAYLRKNDLKQAIRHFREAVTLNSNYRAAENNWNHARELLREDREIEVAPPPRSK